MDGRNEQRVAIKFCFRAVLSGTETLVLVQNGLWELGSEPIKRFYVAFSISRRKGAARRWREGWPSKINSNWGKHCCRCWFKNDRRIASRMLAESLNIPKTSSSDSERGFEKEKVVCTYSSILLDTWAKEKIESHLAKILSRWPMQTFF